MEMRTNSNFFASRDGIIASATLLAIIIHLIMRFALGLDSAANWPLIVLTVIAGIPLMIDVIKGAIAARGGADLLAAVSILSAALLGEWLVAAIIVLMLSGGEALEEAASAKASGTLKALAQRSPSTAHIETPGGLKDIHANDIRVGDEIIVLAHELCPVDGEVVEGHGSMDESFLTGEPYVIPKSAGSAVISGAVNGDTALKIRALRLAEDSRYAQIVGVLKEAEDNRPPMRRMADRLGAWYTLVALSLGVLGWVISGDPSRFLAVVVVATPCPLLIGVPVAIIGAISLSARRGIIIKNPAMLEDVGRSQIVIFDKTGTLTYGRPTLSAVDTAWDEKEVLALAAAVEHYSRHPLAHALIEAARGLELPEVSEVSEKPGQGLVARVGGHQVKLTSRKAVPELGKGAETGMESIMLIDGQYAATFSFHDEPRSKAKDFISHLPEYHAVKRTMILSGDRQAEVERLAKSVGIKEAHGGMSPEEKLAVVKDCAAQGPTLFLGDGINDAPAMTAATAGVAFGASSDITMEAADAVVLDSSLERLDELIHIGHRMRRIALQSVLGGMGLSIIGMFLAVGGVLTPLLGAIAQEVIDIVAILNAARVAMAPKELSDFKD